MCVPLFYYLFPENSGSCLSYLLSLVINNLGTLDLYKNVIQAKSL